MNDLSAERMKDVQFSDIQSFNVGLHTRARRETVCAATVYRHFFGRLEIIPALVSGRLPYRCSARNLVS